MTFGNNLSITWRPSVPPAQEASIELLPTYDYERNYLNLGINRALGIGISLLIVLVGMKFELPLIISVYIYIVFIKPLLLESQADLDWFCLIDWCLMPTLAIFQLYRGMNKFYY